MNGNEYKEKQIQSIVQGQLNRARLLMQKIVHAFVSNLSSRNAMLNYLQHFVKINTKRTHLNVSLIKSTTKNDESLKI